MPHSYQDKIAVICHQNWTSSNTYQRPEGNRPSSDYIIETRISQKTWIAHFPVIFVITLILLDC